MTWQMPGLICLFLSIFNYLGLSHSSSVILNGCCHFYHLSDCCIAQGVEACALPVCDLGANQLELLNILQTGADCIDNNLFKILQCGGGELVVIRIKLTQR